MPFTPTHTAEITKIMEEYLSTVRPEPEIRPQLDIGYKITGQSIILSEIRPRFMSPHIIDAYGYAKATFVKDKNIWKIYWKRADNKWHLYKPNHVVAELQHFLKIVDEDRYFCFKG